MPEQLQIEVFSSAEEKKVYDLNKEIFDLNAKIDLVTAKADFLDYFVAAGSGLLCSLMDILWVGDFDLSRGRTLADDKLGGFVKKTAQILGCKENDVNGCVRFLEKFHIPSDGNTPDFGGGLQHHLRDFAHHPTLVGLIFSLLTQFTKHAYGTDVNGIFRVVPVPEKSLVFIGKNPVNKVINGTLIWFFHLVSDMVGSGKTAGFTGGVGIPGPILSLAKELSVLPFFRGMKVNDTSFSLFLSKLFNGTLLAKRDESGKLIPDSVIRMDLRGELGCAVELGRQALPVIANEAIVRVFCFLRRFASEIKRIDAHSLVDLKKIEWETIALREDPTIIRMLTVATGVFTTVDILDAIITQKYWVSINYIGVCRFAVAIEKEISIALKRRDIKSIREMYETIKRNTFENDDNRIYGRIQDDMNAEKLGLTLEQTEILYNIEYYKTKNDIDKAKHPIESESLKALKRQWLDEWKEYMTLGFDKFIQIDGAILHWYSYEELKKRIDGMDPFGVWYKLVLLEATLFVPYFSLSTEKDKRGKIIPNKKYNQIQSDLCGFNTIQGDKYLSEFFADPYCPPKFILRLRKCYKRTINGLNEVQKKVIQGLLVGTAVLALTIISAGIFAPQIAVALVGSSFTGLHGVALVNACLAYIGGGAVAIGGGGMAGGMVAIVGGGAILGFGAGAGAGGIVASVGMLDKKAVILQSAKLMVAIREIFLNEEKDIEYSDAVYEQYVSNILALEKELAEWKIKADVAASEEKKEIKEKIKNLEASIEAMRNAMKSMKRYIDAFKKGMESE